MLFLTSRVVFSLFIYINFKRRIEQTDKKYSCELKIVIETSHGNIFLKLGYSICLHFGGCSDMWTHTLCRLKFIYLRADIYQTNHKNPTTTIKKNEIEFNFVTVNITMVIDVWRWTLNSNRYVDGRKIENMFDRVWNWKRWRSRMVTSQPQATLTLAVQLFF